MTAKTTAPIRASDITTSPEFVDAKGLRALFGITRSHGYDLADQGLVRTVCLRKPGALRGKRLWDVASVRAYLLSCTDDRALIQHDLEISPVEAMRNALKKPFSPSGEKTCPNPSITREGNATKPKKWRTRGTSDMEAALN